MSFVHRRPPIRTLRGRLTAWYLATLALSLALFVALLYLALSRTLYTHHDQELAEQARSVAERLAGRRLTETTVADALAESRAATRFVMIRNNTGQLLYRSQVLQLSEPDIGRHNALVHAASHGARAPQFFTVTLEQSGAVRFICVPLAGHANVYLQLGDPLGDVRAMLQSLTRVALTLIPVVLVLTSFGGWMVAKRAMAPMQTMNKALQTIQATDLSRRIDVNTGNDELAQLATTVNQLLARLDSAFASLRQFAADASHQLQTPLAVMRGTLDAALSSAGGRETDAKTLEDLVEEVDDMSAIVAALHGLALADATLPTERTTMVDFTQIVDEATEIISALGEAQGISVDSDIHSEVFLRGHGVQLKQMVLNLADNAVKYTAEGGHIAIELAGTANEIILRVRDTGRGIADEHLPRIFDRFYRGDASRGGVDGTGLGLAVSKRIAEVHGGRIAVTTRVGEGSVFTVYLPRT